LSLRVLTADTAADLITAAIAAATVVAAHVRLRVTVAADVPLLAAAAIQRRAVAPHTAEAVLRTVAAVAADMGGNTLDSFPA